jgi:dTDP-4-amino-4,6-dideoxygalactose transaminase
VSALPFFGAARENEDLLEDLLARTADVLRSGKVLQGEAVAAFEAEVAAVAGRKFAVAVGSGTDAVSFALIAAGVGPGDEVLCPDVSFVASALAIARTGAEPVFVDVEQDCMMDLREAAARVTPRTAAVLFVHLFGAMRDPSVALAFAKRHGLLFVEDAAQGFGASFDGRPCGSAGLAAAFSFDPTKVIGAPGCGGAVVTGDASIAERVRRMRYHGRSGGVSVELGYNCQMPTTTAAMLSVKIARHAAWTARRTAIAQRYRAGIAGLQLELIPYAPSVRHVWHKFVLRATNRDALARSLNADGVPTAVHYPTPLHREPIFNRREHRGNGYPRAVEHAATALSLPIHAYLSDAEVDRVISAVHRYAAFAEADPTML